jgi:hypothetical protein
MAEPHQGWIANLSDGNNAFEGQPKPGERSAWQQLLAYCREKNIKITGLQLQRGGIFVNALPVKACSGYFQAYEARMMVNSGKQETRQGIGSIVGDQIFITWVNDLGYVWQEVRELESNKIHTTL